MMLDGDKCWRNRNQEIMIGTVEVWKKWFDWFDFCMLIRETFAKEVAFEKDLVVRWGGWG